MSSLTKIAAIAVLLVISSTTFAGDDASFYAGLGVADVNNKQVCKGSSPSCDDHDVTWNVFGGYNLNENFAAELTYLDLGSYSRGAANGDVTSVELSGLAKLPLWHTESTSFYLRAGLSSTKIDTNYAGSDTNDGQAVWGFGFDTAIKDKIGARLDYRTYNSVGDAKTTGEFDIRVISLAATYAF